MCEVNYDNDPKDDDIQLKATKGCALLMSPPLPACARDRQKTLRNALGSTGAQGDKEMWF